MTRTLLEQLRDMLVSAELNEVERRQFEERVALSLDRLSRGLPALPPSPLADHYTELEIEAAAAAEDAVLSLVNSSSEVH